MPVVAHVTVAGEDKSWEGSRSGPAAVLPGQGRSTATVQRIDLSARRRASIAPADPSPGLGPRLPTHDRRWDGGSRTEPCSCGGSITVYLGHDIAEAVALHNLSTQHQQWRTRLS